MRVFSTGLSAKHLQFVCARSSAALLVALAMLPGCDKKKEPGPPPPPPEVVVIGVAQRDIPITTEWLGTTQGLVNAEIRSRVQGYLQAQLYTDGAFIKAGAPLYKVDPRPFEATLAQATADLARAVANQGRTELDVARLTPLAPSGAVSQQEVDNARQDNEANKAAVKAAQANVEQATLQLSYTDVIAPIDGIAGISNAQIGDLVGGPAGPVLTTISTLDPIRVYFPISEQEYLQFSDSADKVDPLTGKKKRPELDLLLSDGSTYPRKGVVDFVNRQVGTTTGTIQIGATFPNPGNILRPGQYARVRAITKMKTGALLVPQRCIVEVQGFRQVAVVGADGKVSFRSVTTGERIGSDWIIDKGLKADERVIVEGLQKVRDGATVTTRLYDPAAKPAPSASPAESTPPAEAHKKD